MLTMLPGCWWCWGHDDPVRCCVPSRLTSHVVTVEWPFYPLHISVSISYIVFCLEYGKNDFHGDAGNRLWKYRI
jgi:hypothetical protein